MVAFGSTHLRPRSVGGVNMIRVSSRRSRKEALCAVRSVCEEAWSCQLDPGHGLGGVRDVGGWRDGRRGSRARRRPGRSL